MNDEFHGAPFEEFRQPDLVQDLIERLATQRRQAIQDPQTRIQRFVEPRATPELSEFEQYGAHIPKEDDEVMAYIERMLRNQ